MENKSPDKTKEELLNQLYLSATDLQQLIRGMSYCTALKYIKESREEMKEKGYFVPCGRMKVALTKIVRKKFGF